MFCTLIVVILLLIANHSSADCTVKPFKPQAPLPIKSNTREPAIIYPSYQQTEINLQTGEQVHFICPGHDVLYGDIRTPTSVEATCDSSGRFDLMGRQVLWEDIRCNGDIESKARYTADNERCGNTAKFAEVGFEAGAGRFLPIMKICFDYAKETPIYVRHTVISNINNGDNSSTRPFFAQDPGFYRATNVDHYYTRNKHRSTINRLLGLPDWSDKFVKGGDDKRFISRGHLAAKKDFFYKSFQLASFRLLNAAPQWQTLNGFNWNQAEINTRDLASNRNVDLEVCTGVYGNDRLPHEATHQEVELNLINNGNLNTLPVPGIFWKIVYDPARYKGIVLIGINNPYSIDQRNFICPDVSNSVSWLTWNKYNMLEGYSYACTIRSFRYAVINDVHVPNDIPDLTEDNLLD
ncbi:unnamed protein product [Phyllotreta striolata]|uniref:DNA/RNA non-specific endonuclease/pyrophosphatase/phosphodiesterase domain-containing protein n=1 Tax=Phyllotreta striolata TaxID=444603 RepID=A0A9N9XRS3_PHYSR|nr:unnamed protein product [Phyllotreta striolata]